MEDFVTLGGLFTEFVAHGAGILEEFVSGIDAPSVKKGAIYREVWQTRSTASVSLWRSDLAQTGHGWNVDIELWVQPGWGGKTPRLFVYQSYVLDNTPGANRFWGVLYPPPPDEPEWDSSAFANAMEAGADVEQALQLPSVRAEVWSRLEDVKKTLIANRETFIASVLAARAEDVRDYRPGRDARHEL